MGRATVPPALHDPDRREEWGLPADENERGLYMVELNLRYKDGLEEASKAFVEMYRRELPEAAAEAGDPIRISRTYYRCEMSCVEWRRLVKIDEAHESRERLIYRIWPDFPVKPLIDRSVATVKADAALRTYAASGEGIVWAVIDSGVEGDHPHFGDPSRHPHHHALLHPTSPSLHRDFTVARARRHARQGERRHGLPGRLRPRHARRRHPRRRAAGRAQERHRLPGLRAGLRVRPRRGEQGRAPGDAQASRRRGLRGRGADVQAGQPEGARRRRRRPLERRHARPRSTSARR